MANTIYAPTYSGLQAELQRYVEDDTTEYTTDLANIIARAEDKVQIDLDLEMFKDIVTDTPLTISDRDYAKPSGALVVRWMFLTAEEAFLERRTLELCKLYTGTGQPKFFSEKSETTLYLAPTPDQGYSVEVGILRKIPALSGSVATNWLTDNVPDLLLFACLAESEEYLVGDERVPTWKAEYAERLAAARMRFKDLGRKDMVDRGPVTPQTSRETAA